MLCNARLGRGLMIYVWNRNSLGGGGFFMLLDTDTSSEIYCTYRLPLLFPGWRGSCFDRSLMAFWTDMSILDDGRSLEWGL